MLVGGNRASARVAVLLAVVGATSTCNAILGAGDLDFVLDDGGGAGGEVVPGFELSLDPPSATVVQGDDVTLSVHVERRDGFVGPVTITVSNLPANVDAAPLTIDDEADSGSFVLAAEAAAEQGVRALKVTGVSGSLGETVDLELLVRGPPGALDTTFGAAGIATAESDGLGVQARGMALQDDDAIVVAGNGYGDFFAIRRFLPDGGMDPTFGEGGLAVSAPGDGTTAWSVAVRPDGKIVVVGYGSTATQGSLLAYRVLADGTPDAAFGARGFVTAVPATPEYFYAGRGAGFLEDGRMVLAAASNGSAEAFRYDDAGVLDPTFDEDGIAVLPLEEAQAVHVLGDGSVLVSGTTQAGGGNQDLAVVRVDNDGAVDATFGGGGTAVTLVHGEFPPMFVAGDGTIAIAHASGGELAVVRITAEGVLDASFGSNGAASVAGAFDCCNTADSGVAIQGDGQIVAAAGAQGFVVARWTAGGELDQTFGSGGVAFTPIAGFGRIVGLGLQQDGRIVVAGGASGKFVVTRYWP